MSERIVTIQARVSTSALERAVVRLHSGKHPEKLAVIDRELQARRDLARCNFTLRKAA